MYGRGGAHEVGRSWQARPTAPAAPVTLPRSFRGTSERGDHQPADDAGNDAADDSGKADDHRSLKGVEAGIHAIEAYFHVGSHLTHLDAQFADIGIDPSEALVHVAPQVANFLFGCFEAFAHIRAQ